MYFINLSHWNGKKRSKDCQNFKLTLLIFHYTPCSSCSNSGSSFNKKSLTTSGLTFCWQPLDVNPLSSQETQACIYVFNLFKSKQSKQKRRRHKKKMHCNNCLLPPTATLERTWSLHPTKSPFARDVETTAWNPKWTIPVTINWLFQGSGLPAVCMWLKQVSSSPRHNRGWLHSLWKGWGCSAPGSVTCIEWNKRETENKHRGHLFDRAHCHLPRSWQLAQVSSHTRSWI